LRRLKRDRKAKRATRHDLKVRQLQKRHGVLHTTARRLLRVLAGNRTVRIARTFNPAATYVSLCIVPSLVLRAGLWITPKSRRQLPSITLQYDCQQGWRLFISRKLYRMRHGLPTWVLCSDWKDVIRALFELLQEQQGLHETVTATSFRRALSGIRSCAG